nr:unnamed protein product [Digitaria exilis]
MKRLGFLGNGKDDKGDIDNARKKFTRFFTETVDIKSLSALWNLFTAASELTDEELLGAARQAMGWHEGVHLGYQATALLQWKSSLWASAPALDSWRQGTNPCTGNWTGVACSVVHHGHRHPLAVTEISLPNTGIDGHLGELNFSALPFLTYVVQ